MQDRADKNNSRDRDSEDLSEKFTLEFTKEEGMLLLTSARLLDKLVAGVTIHAREMNSLKTSLKNWRIKCLRMWLESPLSWLMP